MTAVRCPKCAAHVAVGADWCGQCYTSMVKAPVKPPRPPLGADTALTVVNESRPGAVALMVDLPRPPPAPPGSIPPPPAAPPAPGTENLRVGKSPWPCVRCETLNDYEENACKACGRGFLEALAEPVSELPLVGAIDTSTGVGKLKVGLIAFVPLVVLILVAFTIAGLVLD